MRYLATALAVLLSCAPAMAQQPPCGPHQGLMDHLEAKYGETPRWRSLDTRGRMVEIFGNDTTGTWTAVHTGPSKHSCVVNAGTGFAAYPAPIPGEDG